MAVIGRGVATRGEVVWRHRESAGGQRNGTVL